MPVNGQGYGLQNPVTGLLVSVGALCGALSLLTWRVHLPGVSTDLASGGL